MDGSRRPISLDEARRRSQEAQEPPTRLPQRGVRRRVQRIADYAGVDAPALARILKGVQ